MCLNEDLLFRCTKYIYRRILYNDRQVKKTFSGLIPLENSELCLHSDRLILQKCFTAEDSMNTGLQRPLQVMVRIFFHLWDIKTNDLLTCSPLSVQQRQP